MKQSLIEYLHKEAYDTDERVKYYLDRIDKIDRMDYKPMKFSIPHFSNATERRAWEIEQLRRTRHGHDGITGMMYQYTYFWSILSKELGIRRPEFRRGMQDMFKIIESCYYGEHAGGLYGDNKGKGLILMGRRRWGKSAGLSNALYNMALHSPHARIGFTSKDEETVNIFFKDSLKFGYDNLPPFLKMTTAAGNSQKKMHFAKRVKINDGHEFVGKNSIIFGRAPSESAFEGTGIKCFAIDEMGKYGAGQLSQLWALTEPALAGDDGITRVGVPILTGTAGDIDENGEDAKNFWTNAKDYGLIKYAVFGWNGFNVDECGNENVIEALKYILDEREKRKRRSSKAYYTFVVQYPLEEEEFFVQAGDSPFDLEIINNRLSYLMKHQPPIQRGYFRRDVAGKVEFMPKEDGDIQILERPQDGMVYAAGCDPTDGSAKANTGSNLSFFIAKGVSLDDEGIDRGAVMQYTAKPQDINVAYEQCAMACEYYSNDMGNCKVLVEKNRARMIAYFELMDLQKYLAKKPRKTGKSESRTKIIEYGVYMDESLSNEMVGEIDNDSRGNIEAYNFPDLLSEMCVYSTENKRKKGDRVDAWGLTLLNLRTVIKNRLLRKKTKEDPFENFGFAFDKSGRVVNLKNK